MQRQERESVCVTVAPPLRGEKEEEKERETEKKKLSTKVCFT